MLCYCWRSVFLSLGGGGCFAFSCEIELIWCHCSHHSLSQGARARHRRGEAFSITCLCIPRGTDDKEVLSCVANLPSCKVFPALKNKTDIFILGCQLQLAPGSIRMPWGCIFPLTLRCWSLIMTGFPYFLRKRVKNWFTSSIKSAPGLDPSS